MLTAQSRQKSYVDLKRWEVEFSVGDLVFLKVSPMKGNMRFGKRGKLSPRFIGPFEILDRVGQVAYRLALPPTLAETHNVFHISMLQKYVPDLTHVLKYENLNLQQDMSYMARPVRVIEKGIKVLRNKTVPLVKILWSDSSDREATWELEKDMQNQYPELFSTIARISSHRDLAERLEVLACGTFHTVAPSSLLQQSALPEQQGREPFAFLEHPATFRV
ncbi:hypothetical protein CsatA_001353 [Cannabis sativa]